MAVTPFHALACPLDGLPLADYGNHWRCPNGHTFDVAREGYLHLLPVQHKRSRDPGDSKEMVAARRRFLAAGAYQPIAVAIAEAVLGNAADAATDAASTLHCLDAGCGEGHYLRELIAAAEGRQALSIVGLDISKWAVQAAAKRDRQSTWIVGSNARLPLLAGTLDRVLCLFGFPVYPEFARVLCPGGLLVQADAGADHLSELRQIIYPTLKPAPNATFLAPPGFSLIDERDVRYHTEIVGAANIADLLAMTPHLFRASHEGKQRLAAFDTLPIHVDVRLRILRRQD